MQNDNYIKLNKAAWNERTEHHYDSDFYDVKGFLEGKSSLNSIELELLGDLKGKKVLHLQCHFGQDSISLSRLGAKVTGVDLSDKAIERAQELAQKSGEEVNFICCDLYDLPNHLEEEFDLVYTSYGTIGWLPDLNLWADLIQSYLRPGGQFVFVEFHPVVWMFDDDFTKVSYNYFQSDPIVELTEGTYTDRKADLQTQTISWNHSIGEVFQALKANDIAVKDLKEYDYSPYPCFAHVEEFEKGKFRIKHHENRIPMVYSLIGMKNER